jgi:hypothetical protein
MKIACTLFFFLFFMTGCASNNNIYHSEVIDTDAQGMATGQYRDVRTGYFDSVYFGAFGGGWGLGGGGGLGGFAVAVQPPPTQGNPLEFARSVAMINYSKKLKSVRYDESGDIIDYEFEGQPRPCKSAPQRLPDTFGRQTVK